uniref:FAD-binding oxidoreductase n=1 Tax=Caenorhabditis tropicalis TaxID=1561998 RepID=A0A1I7TPG9_9PELO
MAREPEETDKLYLKLTPWCMETIAERAPDRPRVLITPAEIQKMIDLSKSFRFEKITNIQELRVVDAKEETAVERKARLADIGVTFNANGSENWPIRDIIGMKKSENGFLFTTVMADHTTSDEPLSNFADGIENFAIQNFFYDNPKVWVAVGN